MKKIINFSLTIMWAASFFLWTNVHMTTKEICAAILCSVITLILTWAVQFMYDKISSLEASVASKKNEADHLIRMRAMAEGRGDRMISLLRTKFRSKVTESKTRCSGMGCFQNDEWGFCSHGYYSRQRSVLKLRTESGNEIMLAPEGEDTIYNHIKDVPNVIDVETSYELLNSYEYEI